MTDTSNQEAAARAPVTLDQVVARVESQNKPFVCRFEKASYLANGCNATILRKIIARHYGIISPETAGAIYWTSYGLFQIMGFNIYGATIDYPNTFFEFVNDRDYQLHAFQQFIGAGGYSSGENFETWDNNRRDRFAGYYNGAGNVAVYSSRLADAFYNIIAERKGSST